MLASGYTVFGLLGFASFRHAENEAVERAKYWLDKIKLTAKADMDAGGLAYGDQRRLEIARAICIEDRKSVVEGKGVSGRVDPGGRRLLIKKILHYINEQNKTRTCINVID